MADDRVVGSSARRAASQWGRDHIARMVVVASFLSLFALVSALVILSRSPNSASASAVAEKAFNAILPVLAGWVGTVLAFYFSAASQEHTSDMLDKAIERNAGRTVDTTQVAEKMIPLSKIIGLKDLSTTKPEDIAITSLKSEFTEKVTRLLFLDGTAFKYLLHRATLDKWLTQPTGNADGKFASLIADPEALIAISKRVAFVSAGSTLAEAKAALDKVSGAQDLIVTTTGAPADPVIGWLTNVDLTKALTVS